MTIEDELERRLAARAGEIDAEPDLAWVQGEAGRRHGRRIRYPAAFGALAVLAGGIVAVATVGVRPFDDRQEAADDEPAPSTAVDATESLLPSVPASTEAPARTPAIVDDPAAPLLDGTVEVYRRDLGDREIVLRRSEDSWAEHFALDWRAPTGTAELCMGDHVLFVGDTAMAGPPGSTVWSPIEEFEDFIGDVAVGQGWSGVTVVRSKGPADEVALVLDGTVRDRTGFDGGLAVLDTTDLWNGEGGTEPLLVLFTAGNPGEPMPLGAPYGRSSEDFQRECTPGAPPVLPLPQAGVQPADPGAAEAEILDAYAAALDRTIVLSEEEPPSVDDITGIEQAAADVDAGEMADVAAGAEHTVDELVFTSPEEAWFRYTISTTMGDFGGRFGQARFNGSNWQITRDTICQDLAMAGGTCVPVSRRVEPPEPENWADVMADYERTSQLYFTTWECLPYPFGPVRSPCTDDGEVPATVAVVPTAEP